jgi:hypothetical protein
MRESFLDSCSAFIILAFCENFAVASTRSAPNQLASPPGQPQLGTPVFLSRMRRRYRHSLRSHVFALLCSASLFLRETLTANAASPPVETVPATTNPMVAKQNGHIVHLPERRSFDHYAAFYWGDEFGGGISTEATKKGLNSLGFGMANQEK